MKCQLPIHSINRTEILDKVVWKYVLQIGMALIIQVYGYSNFQMATPTFFAQIDQCMKKTQNAFKRLVLDKNCSSEAFAKENFI